MIFFICLLLFSCSPGTDIIKIKTVTQIANVDSVLAVLDSLHDVRYALPNSNNNAARRIYAEELFSYRMVDTLGLKFPVIFNKPDSVISAKLDSIILRHGRPDSTTDRGRRIGNRIDTFLALTVAERKTLIKDQRFIGKILYASRNELIAVIEQNEYQINLATKLQVIKKLVIGRLHAKQNITFTAFSFLDVASFDNKLTALRSQYWESEIK